MTRVKMKFNLIFDIDNTEDLDSMGGGIKPLLPRILTKWGRLFKD